MRLIRPLLALAIGLSACAAPPAARPPEAHPALEAVTFMATAAERDALCLQAFAVARASLERALADPSWSACQEAVGDPSHLPPAVICDVDDTLVDTSAFGVQALFDDLPYSHADFADWAARADAPALAGAASFLRGVADRGVTVFYVTGRGEESRADTRRNLERLGFPLRADRETVLCRSDTSDKGPRRAAVAREFRVLLLLGDNLADFSSRFTALDVEARRAAAREAAPWWGERWIVLPNAAYGDWQRAAAGWRELPPDAAARARAEGLRAASQRG